MLRTSLFILLLSTTCWGLRLSNSVSQEMELLESGEGIVPEKYPTTQYQAMTRALAHRQGRIRVMSYNMLLNRREEALEPQHRWPRRLPRIAALIEELQPDVIGSQELYEDQLEALMEYIGDTYAFYGRGTGDGRTQGEINGIFYRKARFKAHLCRVWWMSPTPDKPGPDPFCPLGRTLTMVQLEDCKTGKRFAIFNTHLPYSSPNARDYDARFITNLSGRYARQIPVIVTGDFNLFPNRPELSDLPFHDGDWAHQILTSGCLTDAADISVLGHVGPIATYTNKGTDPTPFVGEGLPGVQLDRIYVSDDICVLLHAVDPAKVDGNYPSDHLPVLADILLWN